MSEVQRADRVIASKARRATANIVLILPLVVSLAWNGWQVVAADQRAAQAERSATSLAETVRQRCLDDAIIIDD